MRKILIGVDIGTTILKAAAFESGTGRLLAKSSRRLKLKVGSGGVRELFPASLDRALAKSFSELKSQLNKEEWKQVAGIGLAAQGGSAVIADRRTGKALSKMMLWNDARSLEFLPMIREQHSALFWRERTFRDEPGWGLARILYLKETRPELVNLNNVYAGAGEYSYFRLTGLWRQDAGNALQIGCYNTRRGCLDQELMDVAEMPVSFVAPMRNGHEVNPLSESGAKRLGGLRPGVPVAGPYMDHEAGYVSALQSSERPLQCSLGTAWVANFILGPEARWTSPFQLVLPSVVGEGWMVCQPLLTGNVTWDWALEHFVSRDIKRALGKLAKIFDADLLPPAGLTALPWFNMPNPLLPSALGAGVFMGINPYTSEAELLRALAGAMVYEMARVLANLKEKRKIDSVVLGGGASKGSFFRSIFSALFDPLPVLFVQGEEVAGTRGALWVFDRDVAAAEAGLATQPDPGTKQRILEAYEFYLKVFERLYEGSPMAAPVRFESGSEGEVKAHD